MRRMPAFAIAAPARIRVSRFACGERARIGRTNAARHRGVTALGHVPRAGAHLKHLLPRSQRSFEILPMQLAIG
jgi:hypothetical protein